VISLRYHIVTIAAVFLALAIGLLAGSAFVEPQLVEQLRSQTDRLRAEVAELEGSLTESRSSVEALDRFVQAALPHLTRDRLLGVSVVVVSQVGVEDEVIAQTTDALGAAGADVLATVSASTLLWSEDPAARAQLAQIVGVVGTTPEELTAAAAAVLAERLATRVSTGPDGSRRDVLADLLSAGFLAPVGIPPGQATLDRIGEPGQVVVVLSGGRGEDPALPPEVFAIPLLESLVALERPVAAGESLGTEVPYVALVRQAGLAGVVTVDDLDRAMGGSALVLGLDRLLRTGDGGAYGVKDGADPLPPPT
jgi:outer membrane murein-binding lipoprotein Lpp